VEDGDRGKLGAEGIAGRKERRKFRCLFWLERREKGEKKG